MMLKIIFTTSPEYGERIGKAWEVGKNVKV